MIIEIGTSDFRTQAGQVDGVFIEPVKYYFDRMKEGAWFRMQNNYANREKGFSDSFELKQRELNTHLENVAISDYEGEAVMHYMPEQVIVGMDWPNWLRGCVSMYDEHPSVVQWIKDNGGDPFEMIEEYTARVVRIKSIIDKYNITALDLLKIDTEGHDCVILNDYLNTVEILPKVIQFQSNELSDPKEVKKVVERLKPLGYDCKQVKFDMVCKRN